MKKLTMSLLLMLYMTLALNMARVYAATPEEDVKLNALVEVDAGTVYYESADQAGSGKNARTVNIYTSDKLYIGGYAILSQDSRLVSYEAYLRDDAKKQKDWKADPEPEDSEQLWVHLYSEGFNEGSIGWVFIKNVHIIIPPKPEIGTAYTLPMPTPEPIPWPTATTSPLIPPEVPDKTPATAGSIEAVAQVIEEASENGKVALLLDASASVSEWSEEIANYAKDMDVDTTIIFGYKAIEISPDEYTEKQWDTGCMSILDFFFAPPTNIPCALNSLPDETYGNVIIVTDTYNNSSDSINERNNIGSVTIVSTVVEEKIDSEIIQDIKTSWGVEPEIQFLESK